MGLWFLRFLSSPDYLNYKIYFFRRRRVHTLIYCFFISVFLGSFLILCTLSSDENLSEKELVRSEEAAKPSSLSQGKIPEFNGTDCQPLHFLPHAENRPITALASFPGSGNTWLRYLIQQATGFHTGFLSQYLDERLQQKGILKCELYQVLFTGIHTGSQYLDERLQQKGFPGESVFDASVAVVKTHECGTEIRGRFQKAILLIRHPKPAIMSFYNLWRGGGHVGIAPKKSYEMRKGKEWKWFFNWYIDEWQRTNLDWIHNFTGPLHIVLYDQLRHDLGPTLRSLVQFLDLPLDEAAIQCTIEHPEGLHHRGARTDNYDPYTEDMKTRLDDVEQFVLKKFKSYLETKPATSNVPLHRFIEKFGLKLYN